MERSLRPASECSAGSDRAYSGSLRRSCGLLQFLEFRRIVRMPPAALEHDAFREDALVAGQVLADHVDVIELALLDAEDGGVADAAWFRLPSSGRCSAIAAFTVDAAITSLSGMPMQRNFDSVVT